MRYSCRHCQRIDFVELTQAPMACPGLIGPPTSLNNPIKEVPTPYEGGSGCLESLDYCPTTSGKDWPECCHLVTASGLGGG